MKYIGLLFSFYVLSCTTAPVTQNSNDLPLPPQVNQSASFSRQLAVEDEMITSGYRNFFEKENYVMRLVKVGKLVHQLHTNMEDKGHPRKRILEKFKADLDQQISLLQNLEAGETALPISWLPAESSAGYQAKVRALQAVKSSAQVMGQLESYMAATKVLDDDHYYEQTFYYGIMKKALDVLGQELNQLPVDPDALQKAQFSYVNYLSTVARKNLSKVFDKRSKPLQVKTDYFLQRIQRTDRVSDAKALLASTDMAYTGSYFADFEYAGSSEIEGIREDMDTKIATYFGLEMIKYLYGQLN